MTGGWCRLRQGARQLSTCRLLATVALVGLAAPQARSQGSGSGFLFQQPSGSLTISGGFSHATAGGDLFSFVNNELTLSKGDFSGPTFGADLSLRVAPRLDVMFGTSYAGTSTPSSYRHFVDQNNAEIRQVTDVRRVPVMLSLKAYLTPQGRSVGRFAWVPAKFAPYVGIGGGAMWYRFHQQGDFVNFQNNNNVFPSDLTSSQWTPAAQGMAGVDFNLTPRVALTGEARYIYAKGKPDQSSFSGFNTIDLSGLSTTIGLTFRY
jgi:opacity protein-like surface antigen